MEFHISLWPYNSSAQRVYFGDVFLRQSFASNLFNQCRCGCVLSISYAKISALSSPLWADAAAVAASQFHLAKSKLRIDFGCINRWDLSHGLKNIHIHFVSETYLSFIEKKPILLDLLKLLSVLFIQQYISLSFAFLLKSFRILCIQICTQLSKNLIRNHRSTWNTSSIFTSLFSWFRFFLLLIRCWWIGDNDLKQKTKTTTTAPPATTQSHWNLSIGREALWHSMLYYYAVKFIYVMQLKKKYVNFYCHKRYDRKTAPESFNTTLVYEFCHHSVHCRHKQLSAHLIHIHIHSEQSRTQNRPTSCSQPNWAEPGHIWTKLCQNLFSMMKWNEYFLFFESISVI